MSLVPLDGVATFRPAHPPREGVVEFAGDRRTVALPIRAALPVLTRAHRRDDLHPSIGLLSGAALLGLRLVAAGRLEPAPPPSTLPSTAPSQAPAAPPSAPPSQAPAWRMGPLPDDDEERVRRLAAARVHDGLDHAAAEAVVRALLDAVADAMPRAAPTRATAGADRAGAPAFQDRLRARLAQAERRSRDDDLPHLVRISLRVEADLEELVAGQVRVVLQVHDEQNPLHLCDAATLWGEADHGFGERARTHAAIALRGAAEAWPVLDRLLALSVPDQLTLDGDELASLLEHGVAALAGRGVDVLWPRSLGRDLTADAVLDHEPAASPAAPGDLQTGLFTQQDLFRFSWRLALHGEPLTPAEMDQLAASAGPLLRLRGHWTVVDPALARKARRRLIREVRPAEAVAATLTGSLRVGPVADGGEEPVVLGASLLRVRERLRAASTSAEVTPPAGLAGRLRDYQRQGLAWLVELTSLGLGACLADDMGLGKTITLIALHLHRLEAGDGSPTLVVCPASLLGNWEAEVRRFAPGVSVRRFHGGGRSVAGLTGADPSSTGGFVLTTYATMRASRDELAAVPWGLVVADEAQHVKNARSATAQALRAIPSRARVALTGTPVENDLTELWSILDWVIPGLLGSRNAFRRAWAAPIESGGEPARTRQFADLVSPFLLRRRKSDPGIAPELPPKTETDHPLGLTREQVVLYESFCRDTLARIERAADEASRRGLVLALLTGLKQICNHPAQFLKESGAVRLTGRSQKLDLLDELVGTVLAEDGAALVFTQYVAMARLVQAHLTRAGVPHQFLHGGTPVRQREAMVERFQAGAAGDVPLLLLSLKAGGTGLNLTRADHVIHLDRWWNPAVEEQATDRAYRIGQTKPVQVHRMITQGTVEERIALLLERKRALADAVLGRGEAALTELSDDELRDLVTLRREDARRHAWEPV